MAKKTIFNIGNREFLNLAKDENGKSINLGPKSSIELEERKADILLAGYPKDLSTVGSRVKSARALKAKAKNLKEKEEKLEKGKEGFKNLVIDFQKDKEEFEKEKADFQKDKEEFEKEKADLKKQNGEKKSNESSK